MFNGKNYPCIALSEIAQSWHKGQPFKKDEITDDGTIPCIHYGELFTKYGIFIENVVSRTNAERLRESVTGDILFPASDVTPVGLTKCSALLVGNVILGGDIIVMRPKKDFNPVYLSFAIRMEKDQLLSRVTGSVVRHISAKSLQSVKIIVPSTRLQDDFAEIIQESDKSKFEIEAAISKINNMLRALTK